MTIDLKNIATLKKFSEHLNVLYVEDDNDLRLATIDILSEFFNNITTATDGQDGLDKFKNDTFDLVISDINMPNMNGITMISEIKRLAPNVVVLIISAYIEPEYFTQTIKLGIDGYIIKPLDLEQFISLIQKSVEKIKLKQELDEYNKNLELKVQEQLEDALEKTRYLQEREKFATMGEMIDTIAHQFKQPLSIIKLRTQMIEFDMNNKTITNDILQESLESINTQLSHAINTINEFKNFFRTDTEKTFITISELFKSIETLMKDELINNNINLTITGDTDTKINVIVNEFKHVILNLITNSKDAFIERDIQNRKIKIHVEKNEDSITISTQDNAGGIKKEHIDKVFVPNFTTKGPEKGTGIGLHISKIILKKIDATIDVENINSGVKFTITIKL